MCEQSELSELSPVCGRLFRKNGTPFCLRAPYRRTSRHPASVSSGLRRPGLSGVVLSSCQNCSIKRTHWAHPARALFLLPAGASSRSVEMLRTNLTGYFDCHFTVCYTQVIMLASTDAFPGGWRQMHGQSAPVQGQAEPSCDTAPTPESYSHSSTVFGRHQEGKRIYLVTMTGAFLHHSAKSDCRFMDMVS